MLVIQGNKTSLVPNDLAVKVGAPIFVLNNNCGAVNVPVNEGFNASAFKFSCVVDALLFNVVKTSVVPINNESLIVNFDILLIYQNLLLPHLSNRQLQMYLDHHKFEI